MKQIVDKLNKIAKTIDENVELSDRDLIIDSLDSITKAFGGTPNDSNLIVDKLDDIAGVAEPKPTGNIEITENTPEGETLNISQYATATVNVSGGGGSQKRYVTIQDTTTVNFSESEELGVSGEITNNSFAVYKFPKLDVTIDNEKKVYTFDNDEGIYVEGEGTKFLESERYPVYEGIALWGDFTEGTHTVKIQGYDEAIEYVDGIQRNYIFKDVKFYGETSELSPAYAPVLNVIFDGVEYKNISAVVNGNDFIWAVGNVCLIDFNYVQNNGMMSVWLADTEDTSEHTISAYYEGQEILWINMKAIDGGTYPCIVNGEAGMTLFGRNETKLISVPVVEYTYKKNILHMFDTQYADPIPSNGYVVGGQLLISDFNTGYINGAELDMNYIGGFSVKLGGSNQ